MGIRVFGLGRARLILAAVVTLSLAAVACVAGVLTENAAEQSRSVEADRQADDAAEVLSRRMEQYVEVLRGVSGWIGQAGWPTHSAFRDYLLRNDVLGRYRGVQVVGAAPLVDRSATARHELDVPASVRREGLEYPAYDVHPETTNPQALPIDYVEPLGGNEPAYGFDLLSENRRLTAALNARDLGAPYATSPVRLVQDHMVGGAGILVMAPVYRAGAPVVAIAQRRAAFTGVVYAAFRLPDLVAAVMPGDGGRTLIYDGGVPLYEPADTSDDGVARQRDVTVAGRHWTLRYRARIHSEPADAYVPYALGAVGVLLALLAGVFFWAMAKGQTRAEARADKTARRMKLLLDCSGEGIYGMDRDGKVTFVNHKAAELLGRKPAELLGRNAHEVMHHRRADGSPYPIEGCPIFHSLWTGESARVDDEVFWRSDGTALPVEYTAAPMRREGVVVTFSDSTVRKRTEQALRDAVELEREGARRLRELDQTRTDFVSTVSHELRTPLTSIGGYLEIILDGDTGPVSPQQREMIDIAHRNSQRLLLLVEDLLTLSRVEAATFELLEHPVAITHLLESVARTVAPLAAAKSQRLTTDIAADCGTVLGDAAQLERVVLNLLSNAVKFTPAHGSITLRAACLGDRVVLTVTDDGIGIPKAEQARLFERFFRSSTARDQAIQGTGLGLSIVKNIVEQHGGTITADSAENAGTTMTITLPCLKVLTS